MERSDEFVLKEMAASFAQVLTQRTLDSKSLKEAFRQAASPEAKAEFNQLGNVIFEHILSTAVTDDDAGKEASATHMFNAMVRRAEIIASTLAAKDPAAEDELVKFFTSIRTSPKFSQYDVEKIYEDLQAPTLAKAFAKAPRLQ